MATTTHPNLNLHNLLVAAAKEGKLDAKYIQDVTKSSVAPTVERDASAYVNWNTTLSLLSRAPAKAWFAGVSMPSVGGFITQPQDRLRDDLSVGTKYWWINDKLPSASYFEVEVFRDQNVLYIDVFAGDRLVALFVGTPTMNVQIQGGTFAFAGEGLWGRAKWIALEFKSFGILQQISSFLTLKYTKEILYD